MGRLWLVWQTAIDGRAQIRARSFDGQLWSQPIEISQGAAAVGNNWSPAIAAGPNGSLAVVWDGYASGSYNVYLRRGGRDGWEPVRTLAGTERFEAHPTVTIDSKNRIWGAWHESGTEWGKDTGRFAPRSGTQLHESRTVRLMCWDGERESATAGASTRFSEMDTGSCRIWSQGQTELPGCLCDT